jgi:hypothetical protein
MRQFTLGTLFIPKVKMLPPIPKRLIYWLPHIAYKTLMQTFGISTIEEVE